MRAPTVRTRSKRILKTTAAVAILATAGIGVLHMPFARSLLMSAGGCPMAGAHLTPETDKRARDMAVAGERGTESAPARPALGFALDSTTLADVKAWEKREDLDCESPHEGLLTCHGVPASALGEASHDKVTDLALQFSPAGKLVNMTTWRDHLTPESASQTARQIVSSLQAQLGPAEKKAGEFDSAHLGQPPAYSIATVSYRYSDYIAEVTAMNAPSGGPSISEHYMSARD
jgi:hypothetical protein